MIRNPIVNVPVEPYQRISSRTICNIYLTIEGFELFKSVSLRITYMDTSNKYVDSEIITLSGHEYLAWGNDDTYLYNYISQLKGITIKLPDVALPTPSVVETPAEETPAETPVEETPVEETPAEETPAEETPI